MRAVRQAGACLLRLAAPSLEACEAVAKQLLGVGCAYAGSSTTQDPTCIAEHEEETHREDPVDEEDEGTEDEGTPPPPAPKEVALSRRRVVPLVAWLARLEDDDEQHPTADVSQSGLSAYERAGVALERIDKHLCLDARSRIAAHCALCAIAAQRQQTESAGFECAAQPAAFRALVTAAVVAAVRRGEALVHAQKAVAGTLRKLQLCATAARGLGEKSEVQLVRSNEAFALSLRMYESELSAREGLRHAQTRELFSAILA